MKTENQSENKNQKDAESADVRPAPTVGPNSAPVREAHKLGPVQSCTQHSAQGNAPSRPRRTPHRRMRRSQPIKLESTCKQSADAQATNSSSAPSVPPPLCSLCNSSSTPSTRRARRPHRASPFQILPEFAQLSAADLAEVHNIIRDVVVPDAQKFIFQRHGISLSGHCLYRYRSRLHLADQLQVSEDNAPAIQNLLGLLAGKP